MSRLQTNRLHLSVEDRRFLRRWRCLRRSGLNHRDFTQYLFGHVLNLTGSVNVHDALGTWLVALGASDLLLLLIR